jgi:hypothetical protein
MKKEKEQKIIMAAFVFYIVMRPKARGLAQHGGLLGWLEESDPGKCDFLCDGRAVPPVFSAPYRLPYQELPSCELMEFPAAGI